MRRYRLFGLLCLAVVLPLGLLVACGGAAPTSPPTATAVPPATAPASATLPPPTATPPPAAVTPTPLTVTLPVDGEALVQERCTRCHSLDRVNAASYDRAGWEQVVARMSGRGAQLNDSERQAVIDYLSSRVAPTLIPHTLEGRESCLTCHPIGGDIPMPEDHEGRTEDLCLTCHEPQ